MCLSLSALHEFPTDLFTHQERTEGAVALHVLCVSEPCFSPSPRPDWLIFSPRAALLRQLAFNQSPADPEASDVD